MKEEGGVRPLRVLLRFREGCPLTYSKLPMHRNVLCRRAHSSTGQLRGRVLLLHNPAWALRRGIYEDRVF